MAHKIKLITFYLPQFHPIPENDLWWGKGFTEWSNVVNAAPRFKGHYQPHLPSDLGFYDLRLHETRQAQADLAKMYGIHGFCYYHYWFNGKLLLQSPFDMVFKSKKPSNPFCLCWANENWTKSWDGEENRVLIKQTYSSRDNVKHINWLLKRFEDKRYIKIHGKPVFLIYRPDLIPDLKNFLSDWNNRASISGFPGLYICAIRTNKVKEDDKYFLQSGFDAIVDFQPNINKFINHSKFLRILDLFKKIYPKNLYNMLKSVVKIHKIYSYKKVTKVLMKEKWPNSYIKFPCVFPSWDNTARRKSPVIIQNNSSKDFGRWLKKSILNVSRYSNDEKIVFINAWNEWAEGCHLEPDKKYGNNFLKEIKKIISEFNNK